MGDGPYVITFDGHARTTVSDNYCIIGWLELKLYIVDIF